MKRLEFVRATIAALAVGVGCQVIGGFEEIELSKGPTACTTDADCAAGEVCALGVCGAACSSDADCESGQTCQAGGCVPLGTVQPDASTGGGGGSGGATGGSGGSGGATAGSGGGTGDGGPTGGSGGVPSVDGGPPPCDENEEPLDNEGIFVASTGSDTSSGTRTSPVLTIAQGIQRARDAGRDILFLAPGPAYEETVVLEDLPNGLTIRGGWTVTNGTEWSADCQPDANEETVIQQPLTAAVNTPAVTIRGNVGAVRLWGLTIETKLVAENGATGEGGESLIGLHIAPDTVGSVTLDDVLIRSNPGGSGGAGVAATDTPASSCDGSSGCVDGAPGAPGENGTTPPHGNFSPTGFIPGKGGLATTGKYGANGIPGASGESNTTCRVCSPVCGIVPRTAGDGTCGCGGPSGDLGTPGGGGGASVAMLVAADVPVVVRGSQLVSGLGGDGGVAGASTASDVGTSGVAGGNLNCYTTCSTPDGIACNRGGLLSLSGGAAGSDGGDGGDSGETAPGVGGPSYALVTVGPTDVAVSGDTALEHRDGGATPGGAPAPSGPRYDQPDLCGNGLLEPGEQCDDGNALDDDACRNDCHVNCTAPGEILDPETGTCYIAFPRAHSMLAARAFCRNYGPGWDIMVPSTDSTWLATRGHLPGPALWVGVQADATGLAFESVNGAALGDPAVLLRSPPAVGADVTGNCFFQYAAGDYGYGLCNVARPVLCERRIAQFQTADCGDGDIDEYEECDDGDTDDTGNGCTSKCTWACPDGGHIVFDAKTCYQRLPVSNPTSETWQQSRDRCQAISVDRLWDLPQFETPEEPDLVIATGKTGLTVPYYWVGATNGAPGPDASVQAWEWLDLGAVDTSDYPALDAAPSESCIWYNGAVTAPLCTTLASLVAGNGTMCEYELP